MKRQNQNSETQHSPTTPENIQKRQLPEIPQNTASNSLPESYEMARAIPDSPGLPSESMASPYEDPVVLKQTAMMSSLLDQIKSSSQSQGEAGDTYGSLDLLNTKPASLPLGVQTPEARGEQVYGQLSTRRKNGTGAGDAVDGQVYANQADAV